MRDKNNFTAVLNEVQPKPLPLRQSSACPFYITAETDDVAFVCDGRERKISFSLKKPGLTNLHGYKAFWLGYEKYVQPQTVDVLAGRIEGTTRLLVFTETMTAVLDLLADHIPQEWRRTTGQSAHGNIPRCVRSESRPPKGRVRG